MTTDLQLLGRQSGLVQFHGIERGRNVFRRAGGRALTDIDAIGVKERAR